MAGGEIRKIKSLREIDNENKIEKYWCIYRGGLY